MIRAFIAGVMLLIAGLAYAQSFPVPGGGGVATITAGTGISVAPASGAGKVTVTNAGVTSLTGTANQVTASSATGAVTLSLPQDIHAGASPTFAAETLTAGPLSVGASPAAAGMVRLPYGSANGIYFRNSNNTNSAGQVSTADNSSDDLVVRARNSSLYLQAASNITFNDGNSVERWRIVASTGALTNASGTLAANATPMTIAGYSLTGSSAVAMLSLAGTLNTSGNVDVIDLNVTQTASGASTNLVRVRDGGTDYLKVGKVGLLTLGSGGGVSCCASSPTTITNLRVYTPSLTPASTAAAVGASTQTFTVTGLATGDTIFVNGPPSTALCPLTGHARVSAADTLELEWVDLTVALCTPAAGTYTIFAIRS